METYVMGILYIGVKNGGGVKGSTGFLSYPIRIRLLYFMFHMELH